MSALKRPAESTHSEHEPASASQDYRPMKLAGDLARSYMRLCAHATTLAYGSIGRSQREMLRSMQPTALVSGWASVQAAGATGMLGIVRTWLAVMSGPMATTPPSRRPDIAPPPTRSDSGPPSIERRTRAVVINFPDRRQRS